MTNQTPDSALDDAVERVWPAIEAWHRGGVGMHTNDWRYSNKRRAEKKAATDAIRQELEARYEAGRRDALVAMSTDEAWLQELSIRDREYTQFIIAKRLATPTETKLTEGTV